MYQVIDLKTGTGPYFVDNPEAYYKQYEELKKEVSKLQTLVEVNTKARDILTTEKAELRQKLADSEELCEDFQEDLVRAKAELQKFREQDCRWRAMTDDLKLKIQKLEAENAKLLEEKKAIQTKKFADAFGEGIKRATMEENSRLKLEVEKLNGLIVEARKYVATANLMLA